MGIVFLLPLVVEVNFQGAVAEVVAVLANYCL
jgi:hypothetical protein